MTDEDRKNKEWEAKHLTKKFPVVELASGDMIWESGSIAKYFAR